MLILFFIIIEGLICFIIKDSLIDIEKFSLFLIIINSLVVCIYLIIRVKEKRFLMIIFFGYCLRLIALLVDIYGRSIYYLPHSGSDTEGFYMQGMMIAENLDKFGTTPMGAYANFLGVFFYIFGDQRLLAQYINTLLGLMVIVAVYKILNLLAINMKSKSIIICVIAFFPQAIIFSGILLRENLVSFGLIMMIYHLIKWYIYRRASPIWLSVLFFGVAVYFHSGVIGAIVPLVFMYAFYKHKHGKFQMDIKAIFILVVFFLLGAFSSIAFGDILFSKFGNVDLTSKEFYQSMGDTIDAGSKYLDWLVYDNIFDVLLYSPLKMFYFLFSPIPLDWRGFMDVITFVLDSFIYLSIFVYIFRYRKGLNKDKPVFYILLFSLLLIIFTFAFGTIAAGTAVRHRNKFLAVLLIIWAIVRKNQDQKKEQNSRKSESEVEMYHRIEEAI